MYTNGIQGWYTMAGSGFSLGNITFSHDFKKKKKKGKPSKLTGVLTKR